MSNNYDNWERLVAAVLRREQDREVALADSRESSFRSISSSSRFGPDSSFREQNPELGAYNSDTVNLLGNKMEKDAVNEGTDEPHHCNKDGPEEFEPNSVCLAKMVQSFIDNKKKPHRFSRNRCNCFNKICTVIFNQELVSFNCFGNSICFPSDAIHLMKSLVPCVNVFERNLLADTAKIVEKNKIIKRKEFCRTIVTNNLIALGYKASIYKSSWEQSPSFPSGEYEYVDVMIEGERIIIDMDFRSVFEIARSTKAYKSILQTLPFIFVGKADRLEEIIDIVSDAAKRSLKEKGFRCPPWRKADYVKAKWLSPYTRTTSGVTDEEVKDLITTKTSS